MATQDRYSLLLSEYSLIKKQYDLAMESYIRAESDFNIRLYQLVNMLEENERKKIHRELFVSPPPPPTTEEAIEPRLEHVKKIYKQIAKKVHPDKAGPAFEDMFKKTLKYYQDGDMHSLLMVADLLSIDHKYEVTEEDCEDLHHKINFFKEEKQKIMSSYAIIWESDKNDEIILDYIKRIIT